MDIVVALAHNQAFMLSRPVEIPAEEAPKPPAYMMPQGMPAETWRPEDDRQHYRTRFEVHESLASLSSVLDEAIPALPTKAESELASPSPFGPASYSVQHVEIRRLDSGYAVNLYGAINEATEFEYVEKDESGKQTTKTVRFKGASLGGMRGPIPKKLWVFLEAEDVARCVLAELRELQETPSS